MKWYCEKCKKIHANEELCPRIQFQLREHPEWFAEATEFTTVAGEYVLVSSQKLDKVAQNLNHIVGANLSYEGTQQFARDIQVFKRLDEECFKNTGYFSSPENAKAYLENISIQAKNNPQAAKVIDYKLTGAAQEVDWLREKRGQLSALINKSELLNKNAKGIDGITINRFNGKTINRTTIKATQLSSTRVQTQRNIENNIRKVKLAVEKGYATQDDIIYGVKGSKDAANKIGISNKVIEKNTPKSIAQSNERLKTKIIEGKATTVPTFQQVGQKMVQGAIIGAVVGVTISSITSYVKYKNGEITREEAFAEVSEDTLKYAITGAAMEAVTIFIPIGPIGFIAGMAIGLYMTQACTNVLDEIYGKGGYGAILNSSGYVYGMTLNLAEYYKRFKTNDIISNENIRKSIYEQQLIESNLDLFDALNK